MSLSKIAICNLALAALGADSIRSFDEKNKRARMADVFFEPARDYLLSRFDWPFARKFIKLNQLTDETEAAPDGYYVYQLPADCETPRDLWPRGSKDWWEVNGQHLLCKKSEEVYIYYTCTELNPTIFSSTFAMLLATYLAVRMSPAVTQDKRVTDSLYSQYQNELRDCWESDANIGNDYRTYDEDPNNDSFVYPDGFIPEDEYGRS